MDGTTREQDKIRRMTLLISVMLLLISGVSYFLYQQSYQTRLQVTVTSKRVLPNTGGGTTTKKKTDEHIMESDMNSTIYDPLELNQNLFNENPFLLNEENSKAPSSPIFRLSNQIEPLP
ncbi:hypothetical protein [Enterococcus raffinosus]|uniref:Uncharacterized protein n=1 Tax=Enterococcus raffinosus TaxID=71452 RepID=A0AAW8TJD1_9ENTE|nr:hypothetical protein [Enterococcus raffinosus]MDT2525870.1 hypothetical protein [Enterococcus raffinosus]MDT2532129.1 hypothetical protein [Enterococcus raffinosus]MDT2536390.1 hypothetical protein [Enterococcus raffinosus]MDT2546855.1 hypothetical protein [Enterococcus raffinosus]MDT2580310.1 hypothetical protein [Enterococcus raffinosus]